MNWSLYCTYRHDIIGGLFIALCLKNKIGVIFSLHYMCIDRIEKVRCSLHCMYIHNSKSELLIAFYRI